MLTALLPPPIIQVDRYAFAELHTTVCLSQQHDPAVGRNIAAAELRLHFAPFTGWKFYALCSTIRHGKTSFIFLVNQLKYILF